MKSPTIAVGDIGVDRGGGAGEGGGGRQGGKWIGRVGSSRWLEWHRRGRLLLALLAGPVAGPGELL